MTRFQRAWREGVAIAVFAVALGFSYTFVQNKGFFAQPAIGKASAAISATPSLVDLQEALTLYQSGEAMFIDSRHEFDYKLGHIKGAVNLPLADYDQKSSVVASLPRNTTLVTYCDGAECNSSLELAAKLAEAGFPSVKVFFAGWSAWQSQHLPVAGPE